MQNLQPGSLTAHAEATNFRAVHIHVCHICSEPFDCTNGDDCVIEDQYAVCFMQACIDEFENPAKEEC